MPLATTIIGDIFTLEQRARMQGVFSGVWGVSSIVGPLIGGFLTARLVALGLLHQPPDRHRGGGDHRHCLLESKRHGPASIDYAGAIVLTSACTILKPAFGGEEATLSTRTLTLSAIAVTMLANFVWIERRAKDPVVPLELFRNASSPSRS